MAINSGGGGRVGDSVGYNNKLYFRAESAAAGLEIFSIDEGDNLKLELDLNASPE